MIVGLKLAGELYTEVPAETVEDEIRQDEQRRHVLMISTPRPASLRVGQK